MACRSLVLIALPVALAGAAALAADPPTPPEKQRLICRGGERQLGTHTRTPQRCRTAEQWQDEEETRSPAPVSLRVTEGQNDGHSSATPR